MYTIYTSPGTGGFAVEAMLEAGNAPWKREIIDTGKDEHRTAGYLAINPAGQVPALILPSGELMTESGAMCLYLGDAHRDTGREITARASARRARRDVRPARRRGGAVFSHCVEFMTKYANND